MPVTRGRGSYFYKLYKFDALQPRTYTLDFTSGTPVYPKLLWDDWETRRDLVELGVEGLSQHLEVFRSEITALEWQDSSCMCPDGLR